VETFGTATQATDGSIMCGCSDSCLDVLVLRVLVFVVLYCLYCVFVWYFLLYTEGGGLGVQPPPEIPKF
jgi:hypothetical protein